MDKVWFIEINGNKEGPYSYSDLKNDPRLTPDTLIWKKGYSRWVPIRYVSELKKLFEDDSSEIAPTEEKNRSSPYDYQEGEAITLDSPKLPPFLFYVILAITITLLILQLR